MAERITYLFKALVTNGPSVVANGALVVDAYDKLEAVVPAGGSITVDVQPGSGGQLLGITASSYEDLEYEVDGSGSAVPLDGPLLLIGPGAVGLLGPTQNQIEFNNAGAADTTVSILVGRDATP
jgi:hypothetical protein